MQKVKKNTIKHLDSGTNQISYLDVSVASNLPHSILALCPEADL